MNCARPNCPCRVSPDNRYVLEGKTYCCEKCARVCTDEHCECSSCDCEKQA